MLFVAYYPEGAHLHDADCEEVDDGLVQEAVSCDAIEADSAFAAVLAVAKSQVWDVPDAVSRCVFYPCTAVSVSDAGPDSVSPAQSERDRPSPGALARRAAEFRPRPLPFGDADQDEIVLAAVYGRKLIWINSLSGERDSASLYPDGRNPDTGIRYNKQTKLDETAAGRRVLTFCATEGGFRSVALDTLLEVK